MQPSETREHSEWALAALRSHPRASAQIGNTERQVVELLYSLAVLCEQSGISLDRLAMAASAQLKASSSWR